MKWERLSELDDVDEQQFLIETQAAICFITDHYAGYPAVLARLATRTLVERLDATRARARRKRH